MESERERGAAATAMSLPAELERSIELYRSLLDNLYDGVCFVDDQMKTAFWNKGAEKITGFRVSEVLGRRCTDGFMTHLDAGGHVLGAHLDPLAKTVEDGKRREARLYIKHKGGYRLPVEIRIISVSNPTGGIIGAAEIFRDISEEITLVEKIKEFSAMALVDELTQVANRRMIEDVLLKKKEKLRSYGERFGLLFADVDNFKRINDEYGHDIGDEVLRLVASTMVTSSRSFDLVGRWGGDEFIVILSGIRQEMLSFIAERYRYLVAENPLTGKKAQIAITVSIGATIAEEDEPIRAIIQRADNLMYESKRKGRNTVTIR